MKLQKVLSLKRVRRDVVSLTLLHDTYMSTVMACVHTVASILAQHDDVINNYGKTTRMKDSASDSCSRKCLNPARVNDRTQAACVLA